MRLALNGQGYNTEAVVRFKTGATSNYDVAYDALYFPSNDPSGIEFASVSADGQDLVINSLDVNQMTALIPLLSETNTAGTYTIEMTEFTEFPVGYSVVLKDNQLGATHLLNGGAYTFNGDPTDLIDRFEITGFPVTTPQVITSIADGNFNNPASWDCNCVPQFTDDIRVVHVIDVNADYSIGGTGTLRVNAGGELAIQSGVELLLQGILINNGQINGELVLNGYAQQSISGGAVNKLKVNNVNGITLSGDLEIQDLLTLTNGTMTINGNKLVLSSTATSSGAMIHENGTINGDVTVEQYIPSDNGHHYLASPLINSTIADLSDDWNLNLEGIILCFITMMNQ